MNIKTKLTYPSYMAAYELIGCSIFEAARRVREHEKSAEVAAGLGLIAADRNYTTEARKFAREVLEVLICG